MALMAIHPGEHLAEELEALNMSAAKLARQLKVPTNMYDLRIAEQKSGKSIRNLPTLKRRKPIHA